MAVQCDIEIEEREQEKKQNKLAQAELLKEKKRYDEGKERVTLFNLVLSFSISSLWNLHRPKAKGS